MLLVLAVVLLGTSTAARLAFWSDAQVAHRFTVGMLATVATNILCIPEVERIVDPATGFMGANTSDITRHLLTVLAGHAWVAAVKIRQWSRRGLRFWHGTSITAAATLVLTYLLSPAFRAPSEVFALSDPSSLVHDWTLLTYTGLMCALLMSTAAVECTEPGVDLRRFAIAMVAFGSLGLAVTLTSAALLAAKPVWLATHYHAITEAGAIPRLVILAAAAVPGLIAAWKRRDDPRHPLSRPLHTKRTPPRRSANSSSSRISRR